MSEIIEAVIGVVAAIFIIIVGLILMGALYSISPFWATIGVILLIVVAIGIVIGFIKSHT
jgi:hypothetical protein